MSEVARILGHAGLGPPADETLRLSVSEATASRDRHEIEASVRDFLHAIASFNHERNGDRPSAGDSPSGAVPRNVAYAVGEVARMLREAGYEDDAWLVDTAWLGLLAGDIDDLREHVGLEAAARRMTTVTYTFAGVPVADYGSAYDWYVRLLGRSADMFPQDTEAVWRLTSSGAIYVVQDPHRAGSGLVTIAVTNLDNQERHLRGAGLSLAEPAAEDAPRRLVVTDPDGNTLTFFQDPAQPAA